MIFLFLSYSISATVQFLLFYLPFHHAVSSSNALSVVLLLLIVISEAFLGFFLILLAWKKNGKTHGSFYFFILLIRTLCFLSKCILPISVAFTMDIFENEESRLNLLFLCILFNMLAHKRLFSQTRKMPKPVSVSPRLLYFLRNSEKYLENMKNIGLSSILFVLVIKNHATLSTGSIVVCIFSASVLVFLIEENEWDVREKSTIKEKNEKKEKKNPKKKSKELSKEAPKEKDQGAFNEKDLEAHPQATESLAKSGEAEGANRSAKMKGQKLAEQMAMLALQNKREKKSRLGIIISDNILKAESDNKLNQQSKLKVMKDKNQEQNSELTPKIKKFLTEGKTSIFQKNETHNNLALVRNVAIASQHLLSKWRSNKSPITTITQIPEAQLRLWQYLPSIFTEGVGIIDKNILFLFNPSFLFFLKTGELEIEKEDLTKEDFSEVQKNWKKYAKRYEVTPSTEENQKISAGDIGNPKNNKLNLLEELESIMSIPEEVLQDSEIQESYVYRRKQRRATVIKNFKKSKQSKLFEIRVFRRKFKEEKSYLTLVKVTEMTQQVKFYSVSSSNKFKKFLINSLAHEVKTPLNHLLSFMKSLKIESTPENVESAHCSFKLFLLVFHGIINLGLEQIGSLNFDPKKFVLERQIERLIKLYDHLFKSRGVVLEFLRESGEEHIVYNDKNMLKIVIFQFLSNALKYTNEGKVTIRVRILLSQSEFEIAVKDTGVGMSDSTQANLRRFLLSNIDSMYSGEKTSSYSTGANLGFMITLTMLQKMYSFLGGLESVHHLGSPILDAIRFESRAGFGSTFYVRIPMRKLSSMRIPTEIGHSKRGIFKDPSPKTCHNITSKNAEIKKSTISLKQEEACESECCVESTLEVKNDEKAYLSAKKYSFIVKSLESNYMTNPGCQCGPKRVLIVDDEEFNLIAFKTIVGSLLKKMTHLKVEVIVARDGAEGVKKFESIFDQSKCPKELKCLPISLIIMDYNMPKMNGPDSIREMIRIFEEESKSYNGKPKIYGFTSYMAQEFRDDFLSSGANGIMKKPISVHELATLLNNI